jgi:redox-sensitive bicupin YhaK (pirin superfamily)
MITVRRAAERGRTRLRWLDSWHTFSFGEYVDPEWMGFGALRVINDDVVAPGAGFPPHSHRDMDIVTWVLAGALRHEDSLGNGSVIRPGDVQRMSAGTGITHSEFNASDTEPVHLLQIWIVPRRRAVPPSYEERAIGRDGLAGGLLLLAADGGRDGAVALDQDVAMYGAVLQPGDEAVHPISSGRSVWLQVARGALEAGGQRLAAGDAVAVRDETRLTLRASAPAEVLLFDLT